MGDPLASISARYDFPGLVSTRFLGGSAVVVWWWLQSLVDNKSTNVNSGNDIRQ